MLSLDLHPIFRNNQDIDNALRTFVLRAASSGEAQAVIIPGKGKAQLAERVLTYLRQPHVRKHVPRAEVDSKNPGRILLYLR